MSKISTLKNTFMMVKGRGGLIVRKYSPEILMVTGVVGIVTSTVLACKATLKADEILNESKETIEKIHKAKEIVDKGESTIEYTDAQYRKELSLTYVQRGVDLVKLYGPAVTLGVVSIACILTSHGIMRKRNLALISAYKTIEQSFADYRKRVVAELGEEKDREFKYGISKVKVTEMGENGKFEEKTVDVIDPNGISQYARIFDDTNINWSPTHDYNIMFLKTQQNFANDLLQARGHVFLNEVYEMLGFDHSTAGAVTGWVKGNGDNFIDFGMFDTAVAGYIDDRVNDTIGEQRRDFINGNRNAVLLDFNVDGIIYNLI